MEVGETVKTWLKFASERDGGKRAREARVREEHEKEREDQHGSEERENEESEGDDTGRYTAYDYAM